MHYRTLGTSGMRVSVIGLGAMTFGTADASSFMYRATIDDAASFAIMDRALEEGVNYIDTADVYGQDGLSERIVGSWLADRGCRDRVVLATKLRRRTGSGPNDTGASRIHIFAAIDASLRRLKTDHIDLYQVHAEDPNTPDDETLRALDDLVRQGKVRHVGACNYTAHRLVRSLWLSERRGLRGFVTLQAQYNLVVREIEREHVPACVEHGVGLVAWAPLAAGFLSGRYRRDVPPAAGSRLDVNQRRFHELQSDHGWRVLEEVRRVAAELDAAPAQVALAWVLAQPGVSAVLAGVRTEAQLLENLAGAALALGRDQLTRLTEVSRVPPDPLYRAIKAAS